MSKNMKTITFSDQEATELSAFYQHKLAEAEKRLLNIKGILQRLSEANLLDTEVIESAGDFDNSPLPEIQDPIVQSQLSVPPVEAPVEEFNTTAIAQESEEELEPLDLEISKYNWNEFILSTLERHATVYTMAEIVDLGIRCYNLNKDERGKISKKVTPFFTHLLKNDEIRKFNIENQQGYFYGLSSWFLKNKRVKKPYITRFTEEGKRAKKEKRFHENDLQNFVAKLLFEERKLLSFDELVDHAKTEFGFPESDRPIFIHNFRDEIRRMVAVNQLVEYDVPNREVHYALPSWFKTNGEIRKPFITW